MTKFFYDISFNFDLNFRLKSQYSQLQNWKNDILKSLSLYYNTFVDLLDFKDHVNDLLTTIDACQIHFEIVYFISTCFNITI